MGKDLFEEVRVLVQCGFVSDLRHPNKEWIREIRHLKLEEYSLDAWGELLHYMQYIQESHPFVSYEELEDYLSKLTA